jgi:hypothetical protein
MKATELLLERASSQIFHYTNIHAGLKILTSGKFELSSTLGSIEEKYAPKGYPYFLSCTRTLTGGYHANTVGDSAVMFNLDGNWYNQRYKAGPVDYWGDRHNDYGRQAEAEDRIFGKTPTMPIAGVTSVHLYVEPMDAKRRANWGEGVPAQARQLLIQAKLKGIKTYFYEDKTAWRRQDTTKCITIHKGQETVTGPSRDRMYSRQTSWLEPWLEMIYKDRSNGLSKKAEQFAYSLAYDSEYYTDAMIKSFANDLSNARKPGAGPDREVAVKMITYMQRNGMNTVAELIAGLKKKWAAIKNKERMPVHESAEQDIVSKWEATGAKVSLHQHKDGTLELSKIVIPKDARSEGAGTKFMQELTNLADQQQVRIVLSPSIDFGASSVARLVNFYKKFGFVQNTGRNKDFTVSYSMYREPKASVNESVYYQGHTHTEYFEGDCAIFAVALNNLTGYPIYGLIENGNLIHAYVKTSNGTIIDASGTDTSIADMLQEFPNEGNAEEVQLTAKQVIDIGYGKGYVPDVAKATEAAKQLLDDEGIL